MKYSGTKLKLAFTPLNVFSALTLLAGRQEEYLACKKLSDEVLMSVLIRLKRSADCLHMVQLIPMHLKTPIISCLI